MPILVRPSGRLVSAREAQPSKAPQPMLVTLGRRVGWADGGECSGKGGVGERGTEGWADGGDADGGGEDELAEGAAVRWW